VSRFQFAIILPLKPVQTLRFWRRSGGKRETKPGLQMSSLYLSECRNKRLMFKTSPSKLLTWILGFFFTVCHCLTIYIHIFVFTNYWQHFPGFIYIARRVSVFIPPSSGALVHCNRPWFTIRCSFSHASLFLVVVLEHLKLVKITVTVSLVLYFSSGVKII
jgi:hypothetical protein